MRAIPDQQFRDSPQDIGAFYVRSDGGDMIPLEALMKLAPTTSAQIIRHYNLFRSAEINGQPAPGVSFGQALEAMETLAAQQLPPGMSTEWTGISLEQKESGGQTLIIFAMGLVFVFLVLAAQYESFSLPFVVILSVPPRGGWDSGPVRPQSDGSGARPLPGHATSQVGGMCLHRHPQG